MQFLISDSPISILQVNEIINQGLKLVLSESAIEKILTCRTYLEQKISTSTEPIYGINTGFGFLQHLPIQNQDIEKLQLNLVRSHACGVGEEVPKEIVKIMLLLKIQSLSYGFSGVQLATVQRLIDFYNENVLPVVYNQGSLGASGDLAPLAHLSLPLIGEGWVNYNNEKKKSAEINTHLGWNPITLKSKEGLALLNGTQFMSASGIYILSKSLHLSRFADYISAISLDAFHCRIDPFIASLHQIRNHKGQADTAKIIFDLLSESEISKTLKSQVQDPYSFRCIPQVHGASKDVIEFAINTFTIEINSVTDNPTIFPDDDLIVSGGNFHGQPLALAFDFLAIALAELGSIAERRTFQLISGQRGLPSFLVSNPGLNSGLMIPQYTAASVASENKQLCTPASVDSIVSSNGQEDHVSMGANAASKCLRVVQNLEKILAIELFTASQAIVFRKPLKTGIELENLLKDYTSKVPFVESDRVLMDDIHESIHFIQNYKINGLYED